MRIEGPTPGRKFGMAILIALLLAIPLFAVYLLVYDRQEQSNTARASIAAGWGGPQTIAGPVLILPYQAETTETVNEGGRQVVRTSMVWRELTLAPEVADLKTELTPERRRRSIYEAVLFEALASGTARFRLPSDLARFGITADRLAYDRAELRFGLKDARGLFGKPPEVTADGRQLALQPGKGTPATNGSGFFTWLDAGTIQSQPMTVSFRYSFRGNGWLALAPQAGDTRWQVTSAWPHPSFQGGFLPTAQQVSDKGFSATWRVGNLALGRSLVSSGDVVPESRTEVTDRYITAIPAGDYEARVDLISPVDLYSQVNRSVKYGFLFIGFTFLAFLMFDVIGGVRVATVEYLLVGAGLVLFFVLLLAFAEVIGFAAAYIVAAGAIIALLAAYSAAVLRSWRRGGYIAALLAALYALLYVLLSLEAYSLLIGSLLLFAALAGVMYLTRNLDWSGPRSQSPTD
ncbi:cell envelope integrity protein CreD [Sphingomonas sp. IC4-52]|uniref:cell envelope integrity protein CreD n=1 Tax=Sphingomonas sp. IC4-52 TaxID=2887202 RepID=UPI001D0FB130|nr:cell envelope integrity protein CreD [Sphingomonas sp. IC4-52]MCC2979375.1 cell envelope integrity protein CreD [Sphingomonas sp. IC4-52]